MAEFTKRMPATPGPRPSGFDKTLVFATSAWRSPRVVFASPESDRVVPLWFVLSSAQTCECCVSSG